MKNLIFIITFIVVSINAFSQSLDNKYVALYGKVRNNAGMLYGIFENGGQETIGSAGWDSGVKGSTNYQLVGNIKDKNGFWFCIRKDLIDKTFYVGNVVNNVGYYYEVSKAKGIRQLQNQTWGTCWEGEKIAWEMGQNGFWICMKK